MSADLIKKIKQNREIKIPVGKYSFVARRPTDVEALELYRSRTAYSEIAQRFVTGWAGVTENDIVGGGGSDAVEFSQELWAEWCADNQNFWEPIAVAVMDAYVYHRRSKEEAGKN